MSFCKAPLRRDDDNDPETTTADWSESLKSELDKTFNEENFMKGLSYVTNLLEKARVSQSLDKIIFNFNFFLI